MPSSQPYQATKWVGMLRFGTPYRKSFTVHRYGRTDAALAAARAWRDELVQSARPLSLYEQSFWYGIHVQTRRGAANVCKSLGVPRP